MLRKITVLMAFVAIVVMVFSIAASAQTMNASAKTDKPAMKSSHKEDWHNSMNELWKESKTLSDDWNKIEEHYVNMMQITDPTQLKAEMAKHQEMMSAYHNQITAEQEMWKKTMALYEPRPSKKATSTHAQATEKTNKMQAPAKH